MPATNYAINSELNSEFRSGSASGSYIEEGISWYIGLSLSEIDDDGEGVLEPERGGYRRVTVPRTAGYWTEPTSGSLTTASSVVFPRSTEHWGTIEEVFISSSSSVGTSGSFIWFHEQLDIPISVLRGEKITIPANAIAINRKE